jgi:hypothetical protein
MKSQGSGSQNRVENRGREAAGGREEGTDPEHDVARNVDTTRL